MKKKSPSIIAAGLALFSMFFGAGNVVFPVLLGDEAGSGVGVASVGFLLAAVFFPLLGLIAMLLYDCDDRAFFGRIGKGPGMLLLGVLVLLLGPLGSTPRLLAVSYGTLQPYLFGMSLTLFSIVAAICLVPFALKAGTTIRLLGYILTPILLVSLAIIIGRGLLDRPDVLPATASIQRPFLAGLEQGYLLLDLSAALLYAGLVLGYFRHESDNQEKAHTIMLVRAVKASCLATVLLCVTYWGLIYVGAYHAAAVNAGGPPEQVLRRVALSFLGPVGGPIASIAVGLACLTTAISQTIVCTSFLKRHVLRGFGGSYLPLALTLTTAVIMTSTLGFSGMVNFLGPILSVLTPALIVFCIANICHKLYRFQPIKVPVVAALLLTLVTYLL